jgi:hypothetical protein
MQNILENMSAADSLSIYCTFGTFNYTPLNPTTESVHEAKYVFTATPPILVQLD